MERTQKTILAVMSILLAAAAATPAAEAFHGGWWRGRDLPSTSAAYPNPGSTATSVETGQVFDLDFQWSGGGGGAGTVTIEMFDQTTGAPVHAITFTAVEDISSVTWVNCPFPNSSGADLEVVPLYRLEAPGLLSLGPGAPGGTGDMRNSFCNDSTVPDGFNPIANDPLYYKAFSDYTGTYLSLSDLPTPTVPPPLSDSITVNQVVSTTFLLDVHVRVLDHA